MTLREWCFTMFDCVCSFGFGSAIARWLLCSPRRIPSLHIAIGATREDRVRVQMGSFVWVFAAEDAEAFGVNMVRCARWVQRRRG